MERVAVNIGDESAEILRQYMAAHGVSATEAVRRAVGVYGFVEAERRRGVRFFVVSRWRRVRELIFI